MNNSAPIVLPPIPALSGTLQLPGSKSISNRLLLLAALADGTTRIEGLLKADDTAVMLTALEQLGVPITETSDAIEVHGRGAPFAEPRDRLTLQLGLAGTAFRSLTAALTLGHGCFDLDGVARMRERPIGDLVAALTPLGAKIEYRSSDGYPPLTIRAQGLRGGTTSIRGNVSSQFLTALLLTAPYAENPVSIAVEGELISKPYVQITLQLMRAFGVEIRHDDYQNFDVPCQRYRSPGHWRVEGDASSASYFLAAGAIAGPGLTIDGLGSEALQGDVAFADVLSAMGARVDVGAAEIRVRPPADGQLRAFDLDLNHIPDAAMTAAVLALFADGPSTLRNIGSWRVKETDRLHAMATELRKVGARVEEFDDALQVQPPATLNTNSIATYGDHRMAMCFSLIALAGIPITIEDPACVGKTFPTFFETFTALSRRNL